MDLIIILTLAGVALLIPTAYAGKIGAPYAPTPIAVVKKAFDMIDVGKSDTVIDIGSGDGKILLEADSREAHAVGYELSPILYAVSLIRTLNKHKIRLRYKNFYKQRKTKATIIFAFLMPENMHRVKKYLGQLKAPNGKYFLAYAFPFKDVEPEMIVREKNCAPIYVYNLKELTV